MRGSSTCICSASRPTGKPPRDTCRDKEGWDGGQSLCSLQPWRGAMRRALSAKLTRSFRERAKSESSEPSPAGCPVRRFLHFLAAPAICCGTWPSRPGLGPVPCWPGYPATVPPARTATPSARRTTRRTPGCSRRSPRLPGLLMRILDESESFRSARFSRKQPKQNAATASSRTMRNRNSSLARPLHRLTGTASERRTRR
jgi:hypothetical protein